MCSKHLTSNKGVTKSQAQTRWQQDPHREAGNDSHVSPVASAIPEGRLAFHQPAARRGQKVTPMAHPTWESHDRPLTNTETRPRPLGCPQHPPLMGWSPRGAARPPAGDGMCLPSVRSATAEVQLCRASVFTSQCAVSRHT